MAFGDSTMDFQGRSLARVRFGAIGEGWGLFKDRMGLWLLTSLVVVVINSAVWTFITATLPDDLRMNLGKPGDFPITVGRGSAFLVGLLESVINGFLYGGMFRIACLQVRGQPAHVSDLFGVGDVAVQLTIGSALAFLIFSIGASCCLLPGLVAAGVLMFVPPLIVDGRLKATEAIQQSWGALKGEMLTVTLFHCVIVVLHSLGAIFCGFGLLFTLPLYSLSIAILYRDFFGKSAFDTSKPIYADPDF
jgi:hypothetical protein